MAAASAGVWEVCVSLFFLLGVHLSLSSEEESGAVYYSSYFFVAAFLIDAFQ